MGTGSDLLVPGFVVKGTNPKTVLLRASGPGLAQFGVAGCLTDPQMQLYNSSSMAIAGNDNWGSLAAQREVRERSKDLGAFDLPAGSRDSLLLMNLQPGLYTAEVRGASSGTGRAIVEFYDADEAPGDARAVNLSARCKVTPTSVAIGGFVVQGEKPKKVLLRAAGPALADFGVPGTLTNPRLKLFSGQTVIAQNQGWDSDASKTSALKDAITVTQAFAFAEGSKDAALLVELAPGNYTVWMESADGASGVGLLEVYEVP